MDKNQAAALNIKLPAEKKIEIQPYISSLKAVLDQYGGYQDPAKSFNLDELTAATDPAKAIGAYALSQMAQQSKSNAMQVLRQAIKDPNHELHGRAAEDLQRVEFLFNKIDQAVGYSPGGSPQPQKQSGSGKSKYTTRAYNPQTGETIGFNPSTGQWEPIK